MNIYKDIRKKMIDKDITWDYLVIKLGYSSWGLRLAIKNNNKIVIDKIYKELNNK